jgi:hypothetical protein
VCQHELCEKISLYVMFLYEKFELTNVVWFLDFMPHFSMCIL